MIRAAHSAFGRHGPAGDSQSRRPQIERRHMAVAPCPLPVNSSSPSLSPTTRPRLAARRPPAPRPPCCCRGAATRASSRGWIPATTGHVRRLAAARTQSGSWLPGRRPLPSASLPPKLGTYAELGTHAGLRGRCPFTLFHPRPCSGLTLAIGRALHSSSHSSFAHSRRGQGMVAYPAASPDGSLGRALAGTHEPTIKATGRLTRRWPSAVRRVRSGPNLPIHGSQVGSGIAPLVPRERGEREVGIGCRDSGRILRASLEVRGSGHDGAWSRQPR